MSSTPKLPDWYDTDPDEEAYVVTHPHVLVYWRGIAAGLLLAGLGFVISATAVFPNAVAGLLNLPLSTQQIASLPTRELLLGGVGTTVLGGLFVLYKYIEYKTKWYLVTSKYVVHRDGFIGNWRRTEDPLHVDNIADWDHEQSMVQIALNMGDVRVYSAGGTDDVDIAMTNMPQSKQVIDIIKTVVSDRSAGAENPVDRTQDGDETTGDESGSGEE